jgi:hypothetical protein
MPCGVVYELMPTSGDWAFSIAHTFDGLNGSKGQFPGGGLAFDNSGNLLGTTVAGGSGACSGGCGTIFELSPSTGGDFSFRMIGAFNGADGDGPTTGVISDAQGNLYGTALEGGNPNCSVSGSTGCGVVFELMP